MNPADLGFEDLTSIPIIPRREVYKQRADLKSHIFKDCPEFVKDYARKLLADQWWILVADQDTGWCNAHYRTIVLPAWLYIKNRSADFKVWYVAHELAHAYDKCKHSHGPEFMEWLKRICPAECLYHELEYKPRNARQAGIRKPGEVDKDNIFDMY